MVSLSPFHSKVGDPNTSITSCSLTSQTCFLNSGGWVRPTEELQSVWWGPVLTYGSITSGCTAEMTPILQVSGRKALGHSEFFQPAAASALVNRHANVGRKPALSLSLRWDNQSLLSDIGAISTHFSEQHLLYFGAGAATSSETEQPDASSTLKRKNFTCVGNLQHCGFSHWRTTTQPLALINQRRCLNLICWWVKWPFKLVFAAMQMCTA